MEMMSSHAVQNKPKINKTTAENLENFVRRSIKVNQKQRVILKAVQVVQSLSSQVNDEMTRYCYFSVNGNWSQWSN